MAGAGQWCLTETEAQSGVQCMRLVGLRFISFVQSIARNRRRRGSRMHEGRPRYLRADGGMSHSSRATLRTKRPDPACKHTHPNGPTRGGYDLAAAGYL